MNAKEKASVIYNALEEKKAMNIKAIDISSLSPIADYFVIASASNVNQLMAFVEQIEEDLVKEKIHSPKTEGKRGSGWVLMDYGDVVVHLFLQDEREFYDIERIWADAPEAVL